MNERLLQFIWQFQYFNKHQLTTDEGEPLHILNAGSFNRNQGPDFLNGSVRISTTTWVGNIELHVKASDWNRHQHTSDPNYRNVVLHVVWENDHSIHQASTLSLKERIPKVLLERYQQLMQGSLQQACRSFLPALSEIGWFAWKERMVAERLERRSKKVMGLLEETKHHWEEVLWRMLAANFGIKVNCEAFEAMARSIPVTTLAKHKNQVNQLEALLLGQANLLNGNYKEDYPRMLQKEFRFLKKKYDLPANTVLPHFLRMRPANFPTIRLAQLAMLVNRSTHLFSKIKEMRSVKELKELLGVCANDYWHYHYKFDEITDHKPKHLGDQMTENIIINTICPVLFAYGSFTGQQTYKDKAVSWLQQLTAEQNAITRQWTAAEVSNRSAFDSQALIELTGNYCNHQRCLDCAVGNKVLQANDIDKNKLTTPA
jgi:hypothetical protein